MAAETRQKILDAANERVLRSGYPATTVDEICETAGVSKGSFYHFFRTKEEMGLGLLAGFYEDFQHRVLGASWSQEIEPEVRLLGFLAHTEENAEALWGEGCLLGGLALDVAETNETMQQRISTILGSLEQSLVPIFEPAATADGLSAEDLAELWLSVVEGSIVLATGHQDPARISRGLATFRNQVERLLEFSSQA